MSAIGAKLGEGRRTQESMLSQIVDQLTQLTATSTEFMATRRSQVLNDVLDSATVILDSAGQWTRDYHVAIGSVTVTNHGGGDVWVSSAGLSSTAPTAGRAVQLVPAGIERTFNITGRQVSLYGQAGATIGLQVFTRPQPPSSSLVQAGGGATSTANLTGVAGVVVGTPLLAANPFREGASFFNDSVAILYLGYCLPAAVSTTNYTTQVAPGQLYELPRPVYDGAISGVWSAAAGAVRITEVS